MCSSKTVRPTKCRAFLDSKSTSCLSHARYRKFVENTPCWLNDQEVKIINALSEVSNHLLSDGSAMLLKIQHYQTLQIMLSLVSSSTLLKIASDHPYDISDSSVTSLMVIFFSFEHIFFYFIHISFLDAFISFINIVSSPRASLYLSALISLFKEICQKNSLIRQQISE